MDIVSPQDGLLTNQPNQTITWTIDGVSYSSDTTLSEGDNVIIRQASDASGNLGSDTIRITLDTQPPEVIITFPEDNFVTDHSPIDITWTVDGVGQTTHISEEIFEGDNIIVRTAADAAGNTGSDTIRITFDSSQPLTEILSPASGFISTSSDVTFSVHVISTILSDIAMLINGENETSSFTLSNGTYTTTKTMDDGHYVLYVFTENRLGRKDTAHVSFKIITAEPETEVMISGMVVDGKVFEPIPGAKVEVVETGSSVTTDAEGMFNLPSGGFGKFKIKVTHPDYTSAMRFVSADKGFDVDLQPILIIAQDTNTAQVSAGEDVTVQLPNNVELDIPSGALSHDLSVSATLYNDIGQLPNEQPGMDVFLFCVELKPDNIVFNSAITVRVPNQNELTEGADVPVTYFNEQTALWEDIGTGTVTDGGEFIEFQTNHFSTFHGNFHGGGGGFAPGGLAGGGDGSGGHCDINTSASGVCVSSGDLTLDYHIPGGRANTDIDVNLVYWSDAANPKKTIWSSIDDVPFSPTYHAWKVFLPGKTCEWLFHGTNSPTGFSYVWDAKDENGATLETGIYPFGIRLTDIVMPGRYRYDVNKPENLWVTYTRPVNIKNYYYGFNVVVNRENSPFGAGWAIGNITKIVGKKAELTNTFPGNAAFRGIDAKERTATPGGDSVVSGFGVSTALGKTRGDLVGAHVCIVGGNSFGTMYWYQDGSNIYRPSYGSHDTLLFTGPGWMRKLSSGTIEMYDRNGLLTSRTDRRGFRTLYTYDDFGERISRITDESTGRYTEFVYDSRDKLGSIIDQFGRETRLTIDNNGNLVEIKGPDGTVARNYEYNADHRCVRKTLAGGGFSQYEYNEWGDVAKTVAPGGKETSYERRTDKTIVNKLEQVGKDVIESFNISNGSTPTYSSQQVHSVPDVTGASYTFYDQFGDTTTHEYNSFDYVSAEKDAAGNKVKFRYSQPCNCGLVSEIEYPDGLIITKDADEKGNLLRTHNSITDATTTYTYITTNGIDYVETITNALG